ncbi:hypothetical protein FHG87_006200 [Trinorchestia longiramus]|nr:hypothetical protein FHG87_006200 [Trinorchestia longiramus]
MNTNSLQQHVNEPTRGNNILDLFPMETLKEHVSFSTNTFGVATSFGTATGELFPVQSSLSMRQEEVGAQGRASAVLEHGSSVPFASGVLQTLLNP